MDIKQAIGARIKELRHKFGYTQEKLAELMNIAPRHISRIENGVNTPSIETLEKFAHVFKTELRELCTYEHLYDEKYIKKSINNLLDNLKPGELKQAYKILNSVFR